MVMNDNTYGSVLCFVISARFIRIAPPFELRTFGRFGGHFKGRRNTKRLSPTLTMPPRNALASTLTALCLAFVPCAYTATPAERTISPPAPPARLADEAPPVEEELISDGGFEGPAPGPWGQNNWAKNEVEFARDTDHPYRGRFSQRLRLVRAVGPADLQLVQRLEDIGPGGGVLVKLAVRGRSNARPLAVEIRRNGPPYTTYSSLSVPPTEDWQMHAFVATLPAVLPADGLGLYIHLNDESTVWIDEVSVGLLPKVDPRGPLAGNQIVNGSFEVGLARWTLYNRDACALADGPRAFENIAGPDGAVEAAADAPAGLSVLRFSVREFCGAYLNSAYVPYRHGHALSASVRIRARSGGGAVELSLGHGQPPTWLGKATATIGSAWQTINLTCIPGPSASGGAFLQVFSKAPGDYMIDDVRVEQTPAVTVAGPVYGCAVIDAPPASLFRGDEQPRLRVRAAGLAPAARIRASLRVCDAWERTIAELPLTLAADDAGYASTELALPRSRFGGFHCALEVANRMEAEAVYSLVPSLPKPDGSGHSFFGGHFQLNPYGLDLAERMGMRWLRLHPPLNTKWMLAEPEQGTCVFQTVGVERAVARGFSVLGSLDTTPKWAATPGNDEPYTWWNSRVPRDWVQWADYVQAAIRAFPGIRHWEVFNEPDIDFLLVPKGTDKAAAYTEILAHTQQAVDALALTAPALAKIELVGLPVSSLDRPFFREVIAKGGATHVDSLGFHFYYEDLDPLEKKPDFLEQLMAMRAARNRSGAEPGIWHTEGGIWIKSAPSWFALYGLPRSETTTQLDGAHTLVRTAVALKALGLKRHFHYAVGGNAGLMWRTECSSLIDLDGSARPGAAAHAAMVWLLDDAEPKGVVTVVVGAAQVRVASFRSPSRGTIRVAWSRLPVVASLVPHLLEGASEVRDLMGNPVNGMPELSAAPIYVITR